MKLTIRQLKRLIKEQVEEVNALDEDVPWVEREYVRYGKEDIEAIKTEIMNAVISAGGSSRADEVSTLLDKLERRIKKQAQGL